MRKRKRGLSFPFFLFVSKLVIEFGMVGVGGVSEMS
jgi:hypothetical protein